MLSQPFCVSEFYNFLIITICKAQKFIVKILTEIIYTNELKQASKSCQKHVVKSINIFLVKVNQILHI